MESRCFLNVFVQPGASSYATSCTEMYRASGSFASALWPIAFSSSSSTYRSIALRRRDDADVANWLHDRKSPEQWPQLKVFFCSIVAMRLLYSLEANSADPGPSRAARDGNDVVDEALHLAAAERAESDGGHHLLRLDRHAVGCPRNGERWGRPRTSVSWHSVVPPSTWIC